ncbi:MAG: hypothetical protein AAF384_13210 [Pseudomonadota bacterium]
MTSDHAKQIKQVGFVSLVQDQPHGSHLKSSVLDSVFWQIPLIGWRADDIVAEVMNRRLKQKGFTVSRPMLTRALEQLKARDWRPPQSVELAEAIYALGEAQQLDMVVVVQGQVTRDFVTDTNQNIRGYGIQKAFESEAMAYSTIFVEAFDIKRRFSVARAAGQRSEPLATHFSVPAGEVQQLAAAAQQVLRTQLEAMVAITVGVAAQEAGF